MAEEVRHPIFARLYQLLSGADENSGQVEHRREMLAGVAGRVIEVGAGNGLNFRHYPPTVSGVVAVEPEDYLRARAKEAAGEAEVPVEVTDGMADALPADDASFDAGVCSLVLCSVPDQATALAELHRVIRPGGELHFYEHVLANNPRFARIQSRAQPVWTFFAGGCHPDRDTAAAIETAGFEIERCRRFAFRPSIIEHLASPKILGTARRP
jgi:ubiquinone/menaquinone biosynthesis C-methylase UbiE